MMNFFNKLEPVTRYIIIINVAVFLSIYFLLPMLGISAEKLVILLGAWIPFTENFHFFQVITHMFMHGYEIGRDGNLTGDFSHLFFNMFGLFMFGSVVESYFKQKKFVILYFASGLGAYILQIAFAYFTSENLQNYGPLVGASGALFGIMVSFAVLLPNAELMFFIIPVPIKAKYLIPIYIGIEIIFGFGSFSNDSVAHFAHVGGGIMGFLLTKYWIKNRFKIN